MKIQKRLHRKDKLIRFKPDREFISNAVNTFLESGGIITQLPRDKRRDNLMVGLTTAGSSAFESRDTIYNR